MQVNITGDERLFVRIAGACHDLGHGERHHLASAASAMAVSAVTPTARHQTDPVCRAGPFSHLFEHVVHTIRPDRKDWSHEVMSLQLFEHILDENGATADGQQLRQRPPARSGGAARPVFE